MKLAAEPMITFQFSKEEVTADEGKISINVNDFQKVILYNSLKAWLKEQTLYFIYIHPPGVFH